ncbi:hypothetical protein ZWY2020_052515 [Hordeum vulgare]|nr:hypothetical protein ZWY2020_052515 [Hordeum vulgare]
MIIFKSRGYILEYHSSGQRSNRARDQERAPWTGPGPHRHGSRRVRTPGARQRPLPGPTPCTEPIPAVRVIPRSTRARISGRRQAFEPFFSSSPRRHNHVVADDPTHRIAPLRPSFPPTILLLLRAALPESSRRISPGDGARSRRTHVPSPARDLPGRPRGADGGGGVP